MDNFEFQNFLKDIKDKIRIPEIEEFAKQARNPVLDEISENYKNSDTYLMLKSLQDSLAYGSGTTHSDSIDEPDNVQMEETKTENLMKNIAILFDSRIAVLNDKLDIANKELATARESAAKSEAKAESYRKEAEENNKITNRKSKINNWIFAIVSAVFGWALGKLF